MPIAKLAHGISGVRIARRTGDIVVIVDVLRFSSTVTTAVANGFTVIPFSDPRRARERGEREGITLGSLSPLDYVNPRFSEVVALASPNGGGCAEAVDADDAGFFGCLLNARAAGRVAREASAGSGADVTVICADELAETETGGLPGARLAIEDYLCCGCILGELKMDLSPEVLVCRRAWDASAHDFRQLITDSISGRWLVDHGQEADLVHCLQRDIYGVVPVIRGGRIEPHTRG